MRKAALGFSLIELLISVSIILLLIGGGTVVFKKFNEKEYVHQAALNLRSDLQDAQKMAMAGFKPAGCDDLLGYRVYFTENKNNEYNIKAECHSGEIDVRSSVKFKNNVVKQSGNLDVTFKILSLGVAFEENENIVFLGITDDYQETVEVTLGGEVKVYLSQ